MTFNSNQLHGLVKKRVAHEHFAAVDSLAFLEFSDVDESIREDVAFLENHPLILPETVISGYRYEVSFLASEERGRLLIQVRDAGRDGEAGQDCLREERWCLVYTSM